MFHWQGSIVVMQSDQRERKKMYLSPKNRRETQKKKEVGGEEGKKLWNKKGDCEMSCNSGYNVRVRGIERIPSIDCFLWEFAFVREPPPPTPFPSENDEDGYLKALGVGRRFNKKYSDIYESVLRPTISKLVGFQSKLKI